MFFHKYLSERWNLSSGAVTYIPINTKNNIRLDPITHQLLRHFATIESNNRNSWIELIKLIRSYPLTLIKSRIRWQFYYRRSALIQTEERYYN